MYVHSLPVAAGNHPATRQRIIPGLINRMNVFDEGFEFGLKVGKQHVDDVTGMFPEFEQKLKELFEELYDPEQPFDQTSNTENCKYCSYSHICYR